MVSPTDLIQTSLVSPTRARACVYVFSATQFLSRADLHNHQHSQDSFIDKPPPSQPNALFSYHWERTFSTSIIFLVISRMFCEWNNKVCILLRLFFSLSIIPEIYPSCQVFQVCSFLLLSSVQWMYHIETDFYVII